MSKILVLGRTMDMGGTEVAMAALLQKLVEKKEDVTLLLVEKSILVICQEKFKIVFDMFFLKKGALYLRS